MHEEDHKTSKALQSLLDEAALLEPALNLDMETLESADRAASKTTKMAYCCRCSAVVGGHRLSLHDAGCHDS
jgi:hypothetical protein